MNAVSFPEKAKKPKNSFSCSGGGAGPCVSVSKVCDGRADCPGGEDEDGCAGGKGRTNGGGNGEMDDLNLVGPQPEQRFAKG